MPLVHSVRRWVPREGLHVSRAQRPNRRPQPDARPRCDDRLLHQSAHKHRPRRVPVRLAQQSHLPGQELHTRAEDHGSATGDLVHTPGDHGDLVLVRCIV